MKKSIAVPAGIALALLVYFLNPFGLAPKAMLTLSIGVLMVFWWVSEALPMPVVALLPLVLFPSFGIGTLKNTALPYADPVIFLFMGGFLLGLAIEKWNLHRRIALNIVRMTGTSGNRIVLGFILSTGFLSMWLSNTATTMMMFPIALSVVNVMKEHPGNGARYDHFAVAIMLSIAYASNLGGIATVIGTPPNVAFVGYMQERYNMTIDFASWMAVCFPLALLLMLSMYVVMVKWLFPNHIKAEESTRMVIREELAKLGPMRVSEKRVLIVFCTTALLWILKDLINQLNLIKLDDTVIAIAGGTALFFIPSGKENTKENALLTWEDTSKMAWGILLLFGGGITLANALENAGLMKQLGEWLAGFAGNGGFVLVVMITILSIFISEVMSNVAQVIVFAPVMAGMADALHINPMLLGVPMTLAASCASMLPMGTPPNAIVFASGHIRLGQMVKAGLVLNLLAIVLISVFCWYVLPVFF